MPLRNPLVLITRPAVRAELFLAALQARCPRPFRPILSPVFEIEPVKFDPPPQAADAVFSSEAGVAAAGEGRGRRAWCVGDRTAEAAAAAGYQAHSADGAVDDLIAMIVATKPETPLVHFRGESSSGDVPAALQKHGIRCEARICYRKAPLAPTLEAMNALQGGEPLLLPLFSPETAKLLQDHGPFTAPLHIIAISDAARDAASGLSPAHMAVAPRPKMSDMVDLVTAQIA